MLHKLYRIALAMLLGAGLQTGVLAQQPASDAFMKEMEAAKAAAAAVMQEGPKDIVLGEQAVLKLPLGYSFIPKAEGARLMTAMGNHTGDDFLGLIFSEKINGFVDVSFEKSGYIKDEDAKDWKVDELLQNLKDGTEQGNKDRAARGLPEMDVIGWVEKPTYEAGTHRLVWSLSTRDKGAPAGAEQGVNYNTYVLGREGYLSLNVVTDLKDIEAEKPLARELLASVSFNQGKRYEDFNASTDHIAEYGLAALVGGIAVKKLGLLAMAGVFLLKMWKVAALAVFGFGAGIRKWLGRKKDDNSKDSDAA